MIHFCPLDRECRKYGAPVRLHVGVGKYHLGIAFTPGSRFGVATKQPDGSWGPPYTARWLDWQVAE